MIIRSCDFMGRNASWLHCVSGDINIPANTVILPQTQDSAFAGYL